RIMPISGPTSRATCSGSGTAGQTTSSSSDMTDRPGQVLQQAADTEPRRHLGVLVDLDLAGDKVDGHQVSLAGVPHQELGFPDRYPRTSRTWRRIALHTHP